MYKRLFVYLILGCIVATIVSFPYLYGFFHTQPGEVFLARSVVNSADTYVYLSHIASAKEGYLLLPNLYTTESKIPFLLRPIYLLLGQMARVLTLDPLTAYHVGRFLLTICFTVAVCYLINLVSRSRREKIFAFFFMYFTSGFGGLLGKYIPSSIDLWVPEANTFFSLTESPHFIWSQTLLVVTVACIYKYLYPSYSGLQPEGAAKRIRGVYAGTNLSCFSIISSRRRFVWIGGLAALGAIIDYPYVAPFIFLFAPLVFLGSNLSWQSKVRSLLCFFLLPTIAIAIIFLTSRLTPVAGYWFAQNTLLTPSLIAVLSGYGFLIPLAVIGIVNSHQNPKVKYLCALWIGLEFILIYSPLPFQRRILLGLHIPLAIGASWGFLYLTQRFKNSLAWGALMVIFIVLPATLVTNIYRMINAYTSPHTRHLFYINTAYISGMEWLRTHTSPQEVIVAHAFTANIIPGFSGRFVYFGQQILTYRFNDKVQEYQNLLTTKDSKGLLRYLSTNGISYIFVSPFEQEEYGAFLRTQQFLTSVWDREGVAILRVLYWSE